MPAGVDFHIEGHERVTGLGLGFNVRGRRRLHPKLAAFFVACYLFRSLFCCLHD